MGGRRPSSRAWSGRRLTRPPLVRPSVLVSALIAAVLATSCESTSSSTTTASTSSAATTSSTARTAASTPASTAAETGSPDDAADLQASLEEVVDRATVPSAIVVVRSGRFGDDTFTFGTTELGGSEPVTTKDHGRVGSVTKTMTATVVLQLVQEGLLALEDPVSTYVTNVPDGDNITVAQLLDMRSGLYSYTEDPEFLQAIEADPQRGWHGQHVPARPRRLGAGGAVRPRLPLRQLRRSAPGRATGAGRRRHADPRGRQRRQPVVGMDGRFGDLDARRSCGVDRRPGRRHAARTRHPTAAPRQHSGHRPDYPQAEGIYGYGYGIDKTGSYYGHGGQILAYNTAMSRDPDTDTTVIAFATLTLAPDGTAVAAALANTVISALPHASAAESTLPGPPGDLLPDG